METTESFRGGVFGGLVGRAIGVARFGGATKVLALGVISLFGVSGNPALGDHVCGGGIPDCAACCVDNPSVPGNCLEVSRTDCVLIHDGNPQAPGSDCHDFNGNGVADACEPDFPFCLPSSDGLMCEGGCPGPLPCNATKVRVNLATFEYEVLECGCRSCRVCLECDAFPPPCIDGCPAGYLCEKTETCYSNEICDIECDCKLDPEPEACCLFNAAITCQERLPADCFAAGGTPQGFGSVCQGHEACCLPDGSCTFVDRICCDDLGGVSQGPGSQCQGTGACCLDVTDDQFLYDTCRDQDKICCAANGGAFQGVGTACELEACCLDGACAMLDADCCVISGGVPGGAGSTCFGGGSGACCYDTNQDFVPDTCFIAEEACCAYAGGNFHGPGSTCSNNVGACCFGFVFGYCRDSINESCCADLEAGLFVGDGTFCLGDGNGNGFDDACEEALCTPNPAGNACNPTQCPSNQEVCVPTKVKCTPSGAVCSIIECTCQDPNRCHIDLPPGSPVPECLGGCPAGESCEEIITIDADGQFLHTCKCVGPEACCLTNFDVTCQMMLPSDCFAFGGIPQGAGTVCLGHEACCLPDGSCTFVDAICCDDLGGSSQGPGSMCEGTGTCCYDITDDFCIYDTCRDQDGVCCAANGGVFQGVGSTCEPEACCIDGLCCDLDAECCVISGGVAAGPGTSCAGVQGACCYDGDGDGISEVCIIADAACCADLGGLFHGPGTTCSPNFGACCFGFTGGSCIEMNESCCADLEAGRFLGNGTFCLGDGNGNGFDDACEACLPSNRVGLGDDLCYNGSAPGLACGWNGDCPTGQACGNKNEYLSFFPDNAGQITALRVTNVSIPDFPALNGQRWWVGPPTSFTECNGAQRTIAQLQCTPYCTDWGAIHLLDVYGGAVLAGSLYGVQAVSCGCDLGDPASYSAIRLIGTSKCGDVVAPFGGGQPNFGDISAVVDCFRCLPIAPRLTRCDIHPCLPPDQLANFLDISRAVEAFRGTGCRCDPGTCP